MGQAATMEFGVGDIVKGGVAGGIVATIGGLLLIIARKMLGAPQDQINSGYAQIFAELRQELRVACRQRDEFKILLEAERVNTLALRGEVRQLHQITNSLTRLLQDHGVKLPPRYKPPAAEAEAGVELVEVTLRQDGLDSDNG